MVSYSTNAPIGQADGVELPLFLQIARAIENDIVDGLLAEEDQAPSTNEIAAFHRINPATALKGINELVAGGVLYKKRGIGMFVATGARDALLGRRRTDFAARFLAPALAEARRLGLTDADVIALIQEAHHG
ncbi:GntR family transcriptional regulator [Propioniciclava sp. MC1683]|uniref:GntR family transcriptional regulator n=1 Tax=Propioniciclava sp. MC1683 TaxID=2760309 RepID=UPI001604000A|nr:GntR family transcriptional regulator [Propioniciclava sp. MC1683]MBB1500252.1 GntR family transcriptional regulator [Propioniciclava sp. MC1683]